jgi:RND family efflux transporter MFP subunit
MKRENEGRELRRVTGDRTPPARGKVFDRQGGVARWLIIAAVLVAAVSVALTLVLTRGAGRNTIAGQPVPAPTIDPVAATGTAPRPGELVITLPPEQIENAKFETAVVTAVSGSETRGSGLRTAGMVQSNAYKETAVFPVVTGIVRQVNAEIGDRVTRGQLLATVFSSELSEAQAAYLSMQAEAERHHLHYQRTAELVELGAASREELEQATAESKAELARLTSMREKLKLLGLSSKQIEELKAADQIKSLVPVEAPLSGTILARGVNPGEVLTGAKELFRIGDLSSVWIVGQVFEKDFASVRVGIAALITTPSYPDRRFTGRVSFIDPRVDPQTRTAQVRIEVNNPGGMLRLGMFVDVTFGEGSPQGSAAALAVPTAAVQTIGQKRVVYLAADKAGSFVQRDVVIGAERDGLTSVLSGLGSGERVVTEGSFLLRAESLKLNPSQPTAAAPNMQEGMQEEREKAPVDVEARTKEAVQSVRIVVGEDGYAPATVRLRKGIPARLTFVRKVEATCATDIKIPDFGIQRDLPLNEPVVISFTPDKTGEYGFACGMNMLRGRIVVR